MARYSTIILEEELKNKVVADFFSGYNTTQIVGRIDFSVAVKSTANSAMPRRRSVFAIYSLADGSHAATGRRRSYGGCNVVDKPLRDDICAAKLYFWMNFCNY